MEVLKQAVALILGGDRELWQIIGTTLVMSLFSTGASVMIGVPAGMLIGQKRFRGKGLILRITNTLMGLPPVLAGLIVFMLFRSVGPFGRLRLMFSLPVMVIAQVLLISPVITGLSAAAAEEKATALMQTAAGLGIPPFRRVMLLLRECTGQLVSVALMGFGRSIAEVGAVSLVGGNIQFKTRVMTTAILLEANRGDFEKALAIGILLLLLALLVNIPAYSLRERLK
ncbi:MAG: ABC transporter permease [Clostridia bacterium]|nr:ABC transporter permease [Clostridia bacterium]